MTPYLAVSALLCSAAVIGLSTGVYRPVSGLVVFLAGLAVFPALSWHLGLPSVSVGFAFLGAWLLGRGLTLSARGPRRCLDWLSAPGPYGTRWAALVTLATLWMSIGLVTPRSRAFEFARASIAEHATALFMVNPAGGIGALQASLVASLGPVLFLAVLELARNTAARRTLRRAFTVGVAAAVVSPLLRLLGVSVEDRPDRGLFATGDLAGFFQDPHSYAAFLVLAIGCLAGAMTTRWRSGWRRAVGSPSFVLLGLAVWALVGTSSHAGLAAAGAGLIVLASLSFSKRTVIPGLAALAIVIVLVVAALPAFLAPDPTQVADLSAAERQALRSRDQRLMLLQKAWVLLAREPLWGIGPQAFYDYPVKPDAVTALADLASYSTTALAETRLELRAENAHNYYLQYAVEYGLPALAALLWLQIGALRATVTAARSRRGPARGRLAGLAAGQAGFLAIGLFSHPMLLPELQAVFWLLAALGVAAHAAERESPQRRHYRPELLVAAVGIYLVLWLASATGFALEPDPPTEDRGFHHWELDARPRRARELFRWSAGSQSVLRTAIAGELLTLTLEAANDPLPPEGVVVRLTTRGRPLEVVRFLEPGSRTVSLYLPPLPRPDTSPPDYRGLQASPLEVTLSVDHVRVPARSSDSRDLRPLGVKVRPLIWSRGRPGSAIGLGDVEVDSEGREFRWISHSASWPVQATDGALEFEIRAAPHPDIRVQPLRVSLYWNADLVREISLDQQGWRTLRLEPVGARPTGVLTVRVDRTWNPRLEGASQDPRDLGVAISGFDW